MQINKLKLLRHKRVSIFYRTLDVPKFNLNNQQLLQYALRLHFPTPNRLEESIWNQEFRRRLEFWLRRKREEIKDIQKGKK